MTGPAGAVLLVGHVVAAVVAYGALGATGVFARRARVATDPFSSDGLRRFFRPGHNLASRVLYVVPVFGFALLLTEPAGDLTRAYPWIGVAIWTVSVGVATSSVWPAESAIQALLAAGPGPGARRAVRDRCRDLERASAVLALLFVAAVVVMVSRV